MIGFFRGIIVLVLTGACGALTYGQDIIKPKNSEEVLVKIIGFTNHKVECKSFYNQTGPSVFLSNNQLDYIKYADGTMLDSIGFANKDQLETAKAIALTQPAATVNATAADAPDTDHDGVPDKEDKCPKLRGPKEHHGCPDSDGDEVFDDEDKCIDQPGPPENHGCPLISEMDTTADADDDGIPDYRDRCPYEKGLPAYEGCPMPRHMVAENKEAPYCDIGFDEGQATLLLSGKMLLDQFIAAKTEELKNTAGYEWLLILKGYADQFEGENAKAKEDLSNQRYQVVYNYLVAHGIPKEIISGDYVGDTEALAPSDTETHRKKNRVVELIQRFKK